jgi:hypothetical protein
MNIVDCREIMLKIFVGVMIAHWLEHLVQAYQVYVLGYERHHAMGLVGHFYPWLVYTEWIISAREHSRISQPVTVAGSA